MGVASNRKALPDYGRWAVFELCRSMQVMGVASKRKTPPDYG